jgi:hypothetical protein
VGSSRCCAMWRRTVWSRSPSSRTGLLACPYMASRRDIFRSRRASSFRPNFEYT